MASSLTLKRVLIRSGSGEFNISNYEGYQSFSNENFAVMITGGSGWNTRYQEWDGRTYSLSETTIQYDPTTGVGSVTFSSGIVDYDSVKGGAQITGDLYLYYLH